MTSENPASEPRDLLCLPPLRSLVSTLQKRYIMVQILDEFYELPTVLHWGQPTEDAEQ